MNLNGLLRQLLRAGVVRSEEIRRLGEGERFPRETLLARLIDTGIVDAGLVTELACHRFALPMLDLDASNHDHLPEVNLPAELLQRHHALPLYRNRHRLLLAVADPSDQEGLDEIRFHSGLSLDLVVAELPKLKAILGQWTRQLALTEFSREELLASEQTIEVLPSPQTRAESDHADDRPVVRFVNRLLLEAIRTGASDVHIEPFESHCRIRFRFDGRLQEMARPPANLASRLARRIKVMARLDLSERRLPQDGRLRMRPQGSRNYDLRVNTLPTLWGEKIVLRILDGAGARLGIDALGLEQSQKAALLRALHRPQGLILVTGPTGSGKTVTLYSGLSLLNRSERNIACAEDPVELQFEGINQVSIDKRKGLDFAAALRAFLRQDPDVIMVGEIRDAETAQMAVRAAQTGHLVLSTLHTNSAAETLTRLLSLNVSPYNLASGLSLIVAQRLLRRLCNRCKQSYPVPARVLPKLAACGSSQPRIFRARGCQHCRGGYRGRVGIYEVVPISRALSLRIMQDANTLDFARAARRAGCFGLRQAALLKVSQGITSLDEANRLT